MGGATAAGGAAGAVGGAGGELPGCSSLRPGHTAQRAQRCGAGGACLVCTWDDAYQPPPVGCGGDVNGGTSTEYCCAACP
jgi:hypothetical protein